MSCWHRRDSDTITAGQISVLASPLFPEVLTLRRLQSFKGTAARLRPRLLGQSLIDDADTIATIASTTTANTSSMVVYEIPAASTTSSAITVATLTFGQAQLLLSKATALENEILAIAAVAVCGNGVCELGERPNATAAAVNATGQFECCLACTFMGRQITVNLWSLRTCKVLHTLTLHAWHCPGDSVHASKLLIYSYSFACT